MTDKSTKELAKDIFNTCIDLSDDTFHAFCEWSPHIKGLTVKVYVVGWYANKMPDWEELLYLEGYDMMTASVEALEAIPSILKSLKRDKPDKPKLSYAVDDVSFTLFVEHESYTWDLDQHEPYILGFVRYILQGAPGVEGRDIEDIVERIMKTLNEIS